MVKTIFLDLDDVCNDFMSYAFRWLGLSLNDDDLTNWSIYDNIANIANNIDIDNINIINSIINNPRELWARLNYDFWRTIPKSKEFDTIVNWCKSVVGVENTVILTGLPPYNTAQCVEGKIAWIKEHLGSGYGYLMGNCKWCCAGSNILLIDDSEINTNEFENHGGEVILFPRPWNTSRHKTLGSILAQYGDQL